MPEVRDDRMREIMDATLVMAEYAHDLLVDMAELAGYTRKRITDLTVGDEIGWGTNEWKLVADAEQTATQEGDGVVRVLFADDTDHVFDPRDIVDVKAAPVQEPF